MSFKRKPSSDTKSQLECEVSHSVGCNGDTNIENPPKDGAILSKNVEIPTETDDTVSQYNNTGQLENGTIHNDVSANGLHVDQIDDQSSFPIPDGLAMDPLAPTALAVSSEFMERIGNGLTLLREHGKKVQKYVWKSRKLDVLRKSWTSIVNVVLIEAKDLPDGPTGGTNSVYCKFKLGTESHKCKQVSKSKPTWCERFNMYLYEDSTLEITLWHKAKQKNFMGRCVIDLSKLEREKTHDLWQELECGYGSLHLLVTLSGTVRSLTVDNVPTTNGVNHRSPADDKYLWYRMDNDWSEVGKLSVTIHGARGLCALGISGKADAYCVLELDNSRVQTHTVRGTSEPYWNKTYNFEVSDITSTLDITVYDESIINSMKGETLGRISIPLLRINNDESRWYALKDRSKKSNAKGNCPRILLQMSIVWNPIKASLRILSPKEMKYVQKQPKFNIPLIYSNLKFVKDVFDAVKVGNEYYMNFLEWENREKSAVVLIIWLSFWYIFRMWMTPLLILAPFVFCWMSYQNANNNALVPTNISDDELSEEDLESTKDERTIKARLYGLQDFTFTIKDGIDYIVSLLERIKNLVNFTVPYLSYFAMVVLLGATAVLYLIPANYIFMALGIYKFTRKVMNPNRVPNNDLLDFLSRVPDDQVLKQWRELKVPEPYSNVSRSSSTRGR